MNSYDVNQLDKLELKKIAIGKKLHKGDSSVSVADDLTINRDLFVDRDIHIVNQIQLGKYTDYGEEMPGAMRVVGSLSVSGNAYLGTNVQTTIVRNDIVVEDTLSVAGSVTVATCQNELPSNFIEFTRTRHATDDNTHVLIEKGDTLGSLLFKGSDGSAWKKYADINTIATSIEENNEGGKIEFKVLSGGGAHSGDDGTNNTADMNILFSIGGENKELGINNEVVINDAGINTDFRVESDLNENMIFVDSLANKIGIGKNSPQYTLDIEGNSRISDHLLLNSISVGADSHGSHKAVIREDLGGSDMGALIYNTQLALFSTDKQSMNMGVMTDGKGVIQVIDNNNPSITYADLGIQPLGGQIAIGKQSANVVLDIEATDSIRIPVGSTAERPAANSSDHIGYLRYNSELKRFEGYGQSLDQQSDTNEWITLSGLKDADNDTYITVENNQGSDNDQIKFFVEDRQEMTLDKSGYLGIGVTNPSTRLHVESNDANYNNTEPIALFRSSSKDTSIRIEGTGESYIELANVNTTGDNTNSWGIGMNNDKNLYFNWKTNSTLNSDTNINERNAMTIMQNGNVGINKLVPNVTFDIEGEDAIRIPRGTTAQRPTTLGLGQIRYNTELHTFEGYGAGNAWGSLGGVKDVDRDTFITAENSAGADNDELKFYTNQFEENITETTVPRMIIKNDGKIGIHTNTPLVKFQVTDQSELTGTDITNGTASIYGTSGQSSYQILNVSHTNQSEYISIGFHEIAKQGTYDGPLKIINKKNNDIVFGTSNTDRMILKNDGKLGLGVSSPDTLLHVQKSGSQEPIAIFESTNSDSSIRIEGKGETYLEIANTDTTGDNTNSWGIGMNDDKNLYFNWKTNGTLNYDTNINERNAMTIMQNGNVGINKAVPNVTFDIEGEDAIRIPRGTTAQRPTTLGLGQIRYNTQLHTFEGYGAGNAWGSLGGVKDVDRDTYITAEDSAGADNDELKFYTGQFEENVTATTVPRMIIKNDGKIGVNIINPLYKTHINGTVGIEDSVTLQDTLSVSGTTNLTGNTIIGSKATTTDQLHVEGTTNITGATNLESTLDVTGASILNSTLSVASDVKVSGNILVQGGKKIHIGGNNVDTPSANDNSLLLISGLANSVEPGMKGTLVKLDNYDNDAVKKVVHWINENDNDDYSFKAKNISNDDGGVHYFRGSLNIGEDSNTQYKLKVTGTTYVSGATTLNSSLSVASQAVLNGNAETLVLRGSGQTPHTYIGFYPDGTTSRKGYFGFGGHNTQTIQLVNEYTNGDIKLGNNTEINGELDVTGDTSVSTFDSSGATSLATGGGIVNISKSGVMTTIKGTLNVDQGVTMDSTLGVTGATTLNNTLDVINATTLSDTLSVAGHTELTSTVTIKGANDVVLKLEADTGNPDTIESEDWNPLIHLSQDNGATNTYFGIVGNSNTGMNPSVANYAYINSNQGIHLGRNGVPSLTVGSNSNVHIGGSTNVDEKLKITGTFKATGNSIIGGTLGVTGATSLNSSLDVTAATTLNNTLDVTGNTTIDSELYVGSKNKINTSGGYAYYQSINNNSAYISLADDLYLNSKTSDITFETGTNSDKRMIIKNDGKVGVGTTGPLSKLHVNGGNITITEGSSNNNGSIKIIPSAPISNGDSGGRIFFQESGNYGISLGYNGGNNNSILNWPSNTFCIAGHNNSANGVVHVAITRNDGDVGIGTTSPSQKLHVVGSQFISNALHFEAADEDKVLFANNTDKSKISHSSGWSVDYHAGNKTPSQSGIHRFMTSNGTEWTEKMGIKRLNNKDYLMLAKNTTIWASNQSYSHDGVLTLQAGWSGNSNSDPTSEHGNMGSIVIDGRHSVQQALTFKTTNTPRMTIMRGGNIGISQTSPTELLDISKQNVDNFIRIRSGDASTKKGGIKLTEYNDEYGFRVYYDASTDKLNIASQTTDGTPTDRLTVVHNGNVGIGTTEPSSKLHIFDNSEGNSSTLILERKVSTFGGSDDGCAIELKAKYDNPGHPAHNSSYRQTRIRAIDDEVSLGSSSGGIAFDTQYYSENNTDYIERMRIKGNGDVGIGTTSPNSKLHVNGTLNITGTATLGSDSSDNLYIKCNDVSLGPNAAHGQARAMVAYNSGSELVLNWGNDFGSGIRIGNAVNGETSNLNVTGGLTVGQGIATTDNTHDNSYANIYKNGDGYAVFSNTRVASNPASISMGAEMYITTPTSSMFFNTGVAPNNTTKMFIGYAGNVGIGTTSPDKKLHVKHGSIEIEENSGELATGPIPELVLRQSKYAYTHNANRGVGTIKFVNSQNTSVNYYNSYASIEGIVRHERKNDMHCPDLGFFVRNVYDGTIREAMTIVGGNNFGTDTEYGNIGIAQTSPTELLDISKENADNFIRIRSGDASTKKGGIKLTKYDNEYGFRVYYDASTDKLNIASQIADGTSTDKVTVQHNGNVGIGTTSPTHKLDVNGTIHVNDHINIEPVGGNTKLIDTKRTSDNWTPVQIVQSYDTTNGGYGGNIEFKTHLNNGIVGDNTTPTTKMFIGAGGKVGIGTNSPNEKLHINGGNITITEGSDGNNGSIKIIPSGADSHGDSGGRIFFQEGGNYGFSLGYNGANNNGILNWPSNKFCIAGHNDSENGVVHVVITRSDGKVGIGTNSPDKKLDVNGTFKASGAATLTDSLTLGTAPASDGNSQATRLLINSRTSNTASFDVYDRKATLGNLDIADNIVQSETNNDTATYSRTILTNTKTNGYSGIHLFNKGNIMITAMKKDWQYYEDMTFYSNNFIWYTGANTGSTDNGPNPTERMRLFEDGSLHIGGATNPAEKLKVTGNTFITGLTTIGNQLHVKGNDICLGPNAQAGQARALVYSSTNSLIINYKNDFSNGVQIGGDDDNSPSSSLNVTGATTIGSTLNVTGATTIGGILTGTRLNGQIRQRGGSGLSTNIHNYMEWFDLSGDAISNRQAWVGFNGSNTFEIENIRGTKTKIKDNTEVGGTLDVTNAATIGGNLTVNGSELVVNGNLIVEGTLNKKNTTELLVKDKTITLSSGATSNLTANGSGIIVEAGGTDKEFKYNSTGDKFTTNIPLEVGGALSATGATTLSSTLSVANSVTCSIISPGLHDIRNAYGNYTTTNFPHPLGIKLSFNRGFSQPIGSSGWSETTADFCDELALSSWAHHSGGGRNSVSITKYNDIKMVLRRASFSNQNESIGGYGGNTKSNQNYREVVLYDHNNLLNTNGNAKVNGTLEATGATTLEGELQLGDPTDEKLKIHVDNANNYAILEYTPKDAQGNDLGKGEISLGGSQTNVAHSTGDIQLNTSSTVRMIIKNDGNIGIGTTDPTSNLCIQSIGYTDISDNQHDTQLSIENSTLNNGYNASMGIGVMDNGKGTIQVKQRNNGTDGYRDLLLQPIAGHVHIGSSGDITEKLRVTGTFRATGATTLGSTLSVASNLKVDGHILLQGGKKFHIGSNNDNTPDPSDDDTIFLISGKHSSTSSEPATNNVMFKIKGYNNDDSNQKVIRYLSENANYGDDYYFKPHSEVNGGSHYYRGKIAIGTESFDSTLTVDGTIRATGITTLGDQLHVKGNDICLGANAEAGQARALVASGNKLILNYKNDFSDGVQIGEASGTSSPTNLIVTGATTLESTLSVGGVLNLSAGTLGAAAHGAVNTELDNKSNTYIEFEGTGAGADTDFALLRQIGTSNSMTLALDFHDDSNDGRFKIRRVDSTGTDADTITDLLHVNGTTVEIPGILEVGGGATGEEYSKIDGHLNLGANVDDAHLRLGAPYGTATLSPRALVRSNSGNGKLIINYASDFPDGVLIESNTKIDGNLEVTGSLSGSAFDSLGGSSFNNITESGSYVGIGTTSPSSELHVNGQVKAVSNGTSLSLIGTDHTYMAFYPQGESVGRKAYIGMAGSGTNTLSINSHGGGIYMDGNVGIGKTPTFKLDVHGLSRIGSTGENEQGLHILSKDGNWEVGSNKSGDGTSSNQFYIYDHHHSKYGLKIQRGNGKVTIPNGLHLYGDKLDSASTYNRLRWTSNNSATFAHTDMGTYAGRSQHLHSGDKVAFHCDGRALFMNGIWYPRTHKESDRRIKRDIQSVEFEETLKIIREIQLRKYTYIDPKNISDEVHHGYRTYGFIAQEMEEAFPLAVDTSFRYIPNIFSFYSNNEDFLTEEDRKSIRCEYITEDNNLLLKVPSLRKKLSDTKNIIDYCKIIVKETILKGEEEIKLKIFKEDDDYTYFKVEKQYYWVFIYGFMVSDFKSVDTDDVMFLHHKAIQDIDTVQQTEQSKVENLETQNTELLSKVSNLETENTQLKDKVADLEKQIKAIKEHLGI